MKGGDTTVCRLGEEAWKLPHRSRKEERSDQGQQ
jgi:hypothetical protein